MQKKKHGFYLSFLRTLQHHWVKAVLKRTVDEPKLPANHLSISGAPYIATDGIKVILHAEFHIALSNS